MPQITTTVTDLTSVLNNQSTALPQVANIQNIVSTTEPVINQTQTDTHNIVNSLFPQLSDFLNTIMSGITGTITGAAGAVQHTVGEILSGKLMDMLTETTLGTACAPDIINVELGGGYFFAVKAIMTSFPDWYVWTGPGDTYSTQSLGTLEVFRGDALIVRVGLHTHTHEIYPLPGIIEAPVISEIAVPIPGGYNVVLVPAPETCWELIGITLP
jgi:hypothetical protein